MSRAAQALAPRVVASCETKPFSRFRSLISRLRSKRSEKGVCHGVVTPYRDEAGLPLSPLLQFTVHSNPITTSELLEKAKAAMDAYCNEHDIQMDLIRSGSRTGLIPKHRAEIVIMLVKEMGLSMGETGRQLGLSTSGVAQILRRR